VVILKEIVAIAKKLYSDSGKNKKWTTCIKEASAEYKKNKK